MLNTGLRDKNGSPLYIGDLVYCTDGYDLVIETGFYGKLICDSTHSCADMPYALNYGRGLVKFPAAFTKQVRRGKVSRVMKKQYLKNTGRRYVKRNWLCVLEN